MKDKESVAFLQKANNKRTSATALNGQVSFEQLFDQSPLAFYTTDREGKITYYNQAAVDLWGRKPELGKEYWCGSWKVYFPDGTPMAVEEYPLAKALKEGKESPVEKILVERPDNSFRHLLPNPKIIKNEQGEMVGVQNVLVDITEHHLNEIKHSHLSAIVESSDDAIISKDLNGTITSWNTAAEKIFKYSEEEIVGKSVKLLIPDSRLDDEDQILRSIKNGESVDHFDTVRKDKYGTEIPISLTVSPIKDLKGNVIGASKVARDISERLQGEQKQAVLAAIVESSEDAIISKDLSGTITSWNAGAEQLFGYTEHEALGKSITILIPQKRLKEEDQIINKIRNGEKIHHFQTIRKKKNGQLIPVSLTVSPVKNSKGVVVGASKIARDITSEVQAQAQIRKYAGNLEILNSLGKSISKKLEVKAILQQVTDATTKLTGAAFGAFFYNDIQEQGANLMLFTLSGAKREAFEKFGMPRSTQIFGPTFTGKDILRVADITKDPRYGHNSPFAGMPAGHPPVKSYFSVPVISSDGTALGGLVFGHPEAGIFTEEHEDLVTNIAAQAAISLDNSRLFEQVKNFSEKKDEFIAVASHELKTPLTIIKGYLQVLSQKENDQISELFIGKSLNQVNKLNSLVDDLLNMSRIEAGKLEFEKESFDLRLMLLELSETFEYSYKTHNLLHDLGTGPVFIDGDKQRIEQALTNLLTNAVKYSPKADKVYLGLSKDQDTVNIHIKDEGMGLSPDQQKKIFSRYYRVDGNKGISGLGIGLYLTQQIIDRHNGKIKVNSQLGKGSEFICSFPLKPGVKK